MAQVVESGGVEKPAKAPEGLSRSGQSGGGARSALEHLVRQERKRDAERAREAEPPVPGPRR